MVCSTLEAFRGVTGRGSDATEGAWAFTTEAMAMTAAERNFVLILIDNKRC